MVRAKRRHIAQALWCGLFVALSVAYSECTEPSDSASERSALDAQQSRVALLEILSEVDAFSAIQRLATQLPKLGPEAVPTVRQLLGDVNLHLRPAEIDLLVRFWAQHAPEETMRWALTTPPEYRQHAILSAFETWAESDPQSAIQAIILTNAGRGSRATLHALIRGWYRSGHPGLVDYIRGLGVGIDRQRALNVLGRAVIDHEGASEAMRWAESLPDEPWRFKLAAYRQLASELAKVDLDSARSWCEAHCEDERFGSNLRERIAHQWAKSDGHAALQWLRDAPTGAERDAAVRGAFRGWRSHDEEALFAWMQGFEPGTLPAWLQPAAGLYAMAISWDRPLEAIGWAGGVPDPDSRALALVTIARRWREQDEASAEAWLLQSPLGEEQRAKARIFPRAYRGRGTGAERGREREAGS